MAQRGQYKKHNDFDDSYKLENLNNIEMLTLSKNRSYMVSVVMKVKHKLDSNNIYKYINFVEIFSRFDLKNEQIIQFLNGFARFYNSSPLVNNDQKIKWLKTRISKQSNSSEKNLFFTILAHKYKSKLLEYLNYYISGQIAEIEKRNQFIDEFKNKIKLVENQVQNINDSPIKNTFTDGKAFDDQQNYDDDELDDCYFDNDNPNETFDIFSDYY